MRTDKVAIFIIVNNRLHDIAVGIVAQMDTHASVLQPFRTQCKALVNGIAAFSLIVELVIDVDCYQRWRIVQ